MFLTNLRHLLLLIFVFWVFDLQQYDIRTLTNIKSNTCNYVEIKSTYNKHILYNQWIFRFFLVLSSNEKPHKNTSFALLFILCLFCQMNVWLIDKPKENRKRFSIYFAWRHSASPPNFDSHHKNEYYLRKRYPASKNLFLNDTFSIKLIKNRPPPLSRQMMIQQHCLLHRVNSITFFVIKQFISFR